MKLPAFQFYPGDWRKDPGVQALDFFARGVWFEILCLMHESEPRGVLLLNGRPMPPEALASLLGLPLDLLNQNLSKIEAYGVSGRDEHTGALMCRRMVRDEKLREIRREAGKQGGNPNLVNQNSTKASSKSQAKSKKRVNQIPTPSSSSSITDNNIKEGVFEGLNGALSEVQHATLSAKDKAQKDGATREAFALARKRYPGTKLGEAVEWENFKKQHSNDPNFLDLPDTILKAIEAQERSRSALKQANRFVPEWAHFKTWINQRRWEQESEAPGKQFPSIEPAKRIVNSKSLFGDLKPGAC